MPAKNAAPYLKECLDSIVNQTHTDWELIVVNDHSTDGTLDILNDFALKDERIRVHSNLDHGIIKALTLAYSNSEGEFITRMDADDIMEPHKLETLLEVTQGKNVISTSYVKYFSEFGLGDGYYKYEQWLNGLIDNNSHYQEVYKECVLPSPNWMMSREVLDHLGGFESLVYPEDYHLCFRAYSRDVKIIGVKEVLHYWRDYPTRTSRTDDNYKDNAFLPLKIRYFLKVDHDPSKRLILWGAGSRGKKLAQLLMENKIEFEWITNNSKKLDAPIFGKELRSADQLADNSQIIIAVAGPDDQLEIKKLLEEKSGIDAYWFC